MYQSNAYYPNESGYYNNPNTTYYKDKSGDRIIGGGFLGPFILGGITGGLVSPYFYGPYRPYPNRPFYPPYGPYRPYPRW